MIQVSHGSHACRMVVCPYYWVPTWGLWYWASDVDFSTVVWPYFHFYESVCGLCTSCMTRISPYASSHLDIEDLSVFSSHLEPKKCQKQNYRYPFKDLFVPWLSIPRYPKYNRTRSKIPFAAQLLRNTCVTMATSSFGPYHGLWSEDAPIKCIGVIPTPHTMGDDAYAWIGLIPSTSQVVRAIPDNVFHDFLECAQYWWCRHWNINTRLLYES